MPNWSTMTEDLPQPISDSIVSNTLALNNAHSVELSWLDVDSVKIVAEPDICRDQQVCMTLRWRKPDSNHQSRVT